MGAIKKETLNSKQKSNQELFDEKVLAFEEECKKRCDSISKEIAIREKMANNPKVHYEYWIKNEEKDPNKIEFIVAFIREPHILNTIQAMDLLVAGKLHQAGYNLFDVCVLKDSSPEAFDDKYKVGLCMKLGLLLDVANPAEKKS